MCLRGTAPKRLCREPLWTLGDQDVPSWTSLAFLKLKGEKKLDTFVTVQGLRGYRLTAECMVADVRRRCVCSAGTVWYSHLLTAVQRREKAVGKTKNPHSRKTGFLRRAGSKRKERDTLYPALQWTIGDLIR